MGLFYWFLLCEDLACMRSKEKVTENLMVFNLYDKSCLFLGYFIVFGWTVSLFVVTREQYWHYSSLWENWDNMYILPEHID